MSVERTHVGHQTRYELLDETGLSCVLTFTADPDEPAAWKILLPGPDGTEELYGTHRLPDPDAAALRAWLSPIVGSDRAAELADAVEAAPPPPAAWKHLGWLTIGDDMSRQPLILEVMAHAGDGHPA